MPDDERGPCREADPVFVFCGRVGREEASSAGWQRRAQAFGTSGLWPVILLLARHGAQLRVPGFDAPAGLTSASHRHDAEILSGAAPPASTRSRLATLRRRSGGNGHRRRSQSQQQRSAQ